MSKYDYRRETTSNIIEWIKMNGVLEEAKEQEWSYQELYDWLYDELWVHDCITGNGPYCYANEEQCEEYVAKNLDLYFEAANDLCDFPSAGTPWIYKNPAQHMDATIRCYLFGECLYQALDDLGVKDDS